MTHTRSDGSDGIRPLLAYYYNHLLIFFIVVVNELVLNWCCLVALYMNNGQVIACYISYLHNFNSLS